MLVSTGRWGEVTIKKQGESKNIFDKTKSFSIMNTTNEYTLEQLHEIYTIVTNLSEKYKFNALKNGLKNLSRAYEGT
jgi:hypothetical protein